MCGSREWYLGVVSFRAWRTLILPYASTNIRLTVTAAFIHCVYLCQYEGMRDTALFMHMESDRKGGSRDLILEADLGGHGEYNATSLLFLEYKG